MFRVERNRDPSRAGFQDRDVGRSNYNFDLGPDYGVDYARFTDPPDFAVDHGLWEKVMVLLEKIPKKELSGPEVIVRNGFVILKGSALDEGTRKRIGEMVQMLEGVRDVINHLRSDFKVGE